MKLIQITQGYSVMVDDADYDDLMQWKWQARNNGYTVYAQRTVGKRPRKTLNMHAYLMGRTWVDHKDANGLNNQRTNLRLCSESQNAMNRSLNSNSTSGFKGVSYHKDRRKFQAYIKHKGKMIYLGLHETAVQGAKVYNEAALKMFGEFAKLNPV